MLRNILTLTGLLMATPVLANHWSHISLLSEDGVKVSVDYIANYHHDSSYKPTHTYTADEVHINVSSEEIGPEVRVTAVLINYESGHSYFGESHSLPWTYELIDLNWQETGHFSGKLTDANVSRSYMNYDYYHPIVIKTFGYGGTQYFHQEVAIVMNGQWLVDPISQSHNFKINLFDQR